MLFDGPRRSLVLSALVGLLVGPSCVGAARTFDAYEADAVATAEDVRSAAATAVLAVDASQAERVTPNYLTVVLVEAEGAAGSAEAQFTSVQPPGPDADRLSRELSALVEDTTAVLTELRVAVRRSDLEALPETAAPLVDLVEQLDAFALEHER